MPRTLKALLVVMFVGGSVFAAAPGPGDPVVPGAPKARSVLTPQEMLSEGQGYVQKILQVQAMIQDLQDKARKGKDVIRLNCVTDKLVQVKINRNIAEQAMSALQEDVARNDADAVAHGFSRLTIVHQKALTLQAEAQNCVGESDLYVGQTRVETEEDPNLPKSDGTEPPMGRPDYDRPPEASTYK